ncbi:hypothetical protein [Nocardioides sp. ChNu-99]|uniref:hypothetical protein n=1 Tax=Nocardioides sp. ChNu-99 TaxID=2839897 RepID=UPI0024065A3F|nr:hypothetical protein [Nocardioides sp. ChNu-99]MDF9716470.1 hypothetical protein [Nocardioides sp. ChNu-99]
MNWWSREPLTSRLINRRTEQSTTRRSLAFRASRGGATAAVVLFPVLVFGGCGAQDQAGDSAESPATTASDSRSVGTSWRPSDTASGPAGGTGDAGEEAPALDGVLPAAADPQAAVEPARAALAAWARPDLPHSQWWAGFSPYLSERGVAAYEATDPTVIPALQVAGPARLAPPDESGQTVVDVTTSQGVFGVQMVWVGDGWAVDRFYFPGSPRE